MSTQTEVRKPTPEEIASGYWLCQRCGFIGEPKNQGEANQYCPFCREQGSKWIAPGQVQSSKFNVQGSTAAIEDRKSKIENAATVQTLTPLQQKVVDEARCCQCKHPAFILIKVKSVISTIDMVEGWMCRSCLAELIKGGAAK